MHSPVNRKEMTCLLVAALLLTAGTASSAEFLPLEFGANSILLAKDSLNVSEDGAIVVGGTPELNLVRWSRAGGSEVLDNPVFGSAHLSGDGSLIVYSTSDAIGKFTPDGHEVIAGFNAQAFSQDGSTIVGWRCNRNGCVNYVLLEGDEVTDLPIPYLGGNASHGPRAVSADGSTIVGTHPGYRWSQEEGLHYLPGLDGDVGITVAALAVSSDGRWTVGVANWVPELTQCRAVRWDGLSPPEPLLALNETWGASAIDVSADARTIVGRLYLADESLIENVEAGIWTESTGVMQPLKDLLISHYGLGESVEGYHLSGVYDVTDDGRFMVGHMVNPNGADEAFLVDLGLKGDFNGDELRDIDDLNMLSAAIQSNDNNLTFDLDYSNTIDFEDQRYWVKELKYTWFGDANLDGEFNSSDFTTVFLAGEYEDAIADNSGWAEGDWDGDADFTSKDMIAAFLDGGYEQGPRDAVSAVPEPTSAWLLLTGTLPLALRTGRLGRRVAK